MPLTAFSPHPSRSDHRHLFTFPNNQSLRVGQGDARGPKSEMGFIGRLGKPSRVRAKQAKEVKQVFKRALDFSPRRSSNVLPNNRKRKRPLETKEELAYWLSKSNDKASEKQFFVRPVRPNRPFRTLPPRLVPAGVLLYIVPAFLGGYNFIFMAFVHVYTL